mmetsp:Transcript_2854/g.4700  ORF Transcript_2854/g.4700 Transcript_2854/m.4700 type:complete len:115 (+) Transcript_2854:583-927(+)
MGKGVSSEERWITEKCQEDDFNMHCTVGCKMKYQIGDTHRTCHCWEEVDYPSQLNVHHKLITENKKKSKQRSQQMYDTRLKRSASVSYFSKFNTLTNVINHSCPFLDNLFQPTP